MESMAWEILDAINYCYNDNTEDGRGLIKDCMMYLKKINNNDGKLELQIDEWLKENGYCTSCGGELMEYEWVENGENWTEYYCPRCDVYR